MLGDEVNAPDGQPAPAGRPARRLTARGDVKPYSQIAHLAEDVVPFIAIDEILRENGFEAPAIFASSIRKGLLLGEHLGREGIVGPDGTPIGERYGEAARLLARLHGADWPRHFAGKDGDGEDYDHVLPAYDEPAWLIEVSLMADWYVPGQTGQPAVR